MSTSKELISSPKIRIFWDISAFYLFTQQQMYFLNSYLIYIEHLLLTIEWLIFNYIIIDIVEE